jgi:hypothetical protein
MPVKKTKVEPTEETTEEITEETLEVPMEVETLESEAKQAYRELIEKYAEQNPTKYAQKKEALLEKLNQM